MKCQLCKEVDLAFIDAEPLPAPELRSRLLDKDPLGKFVPDEVYFCSFCSDEYWTATGQSIE